MAKIKARISATSKIGNLNEKRGEHTWIKGMREWRGNAVKCQNNTLRDC